MSAIEFDSLIAQLLPKVLADRELGDGRSFTKLHMSNLWALSCMYAGECYDEELLARRVQYHLPPQVQMVHEARS